MTAPCHPPESIERRRVGQEHGFGFLSVNHYGALVLNANRVFFGDIDCVPDPRKPEKDVTSWSEAYRRIRIVIDHYGLTFRLYRTFAGIRLLEITKFHDPKAPELGGIMATLGCDPLYRLLTQRFANFRVRLSPKPWRAPESIEFIGPESVDAYERSATHAVARYLGTVGETGRVSAEISQVIRLHDHFCRAYSTLPLA